MLVKLGGGGGGRDDSGGGCDYGGFGGRCWSYREKGVGGGEREAVTSTVVLGVGPVDGRAAGWRFCRRLAVAVVDDRWSAHVDLSAKSLVRFTGRAPPHHSSSTQLLSYRFRKNN